MTTTERLIARYGDPLKDRATFEKKWMTLLKYPLDVASHIPALGSAVYCNKDFEVPYLAFLRLLISRGLHTEIKANDQCFMVRAIRGTEKLPHPVPSIHSWGLAVDLNPADNPLGVTRQEAINKGLHPFTELFQQAGRDAGFVCGIDFQRKDGMHFERTRGL